ncbi:hypothetical protein LV478_11680 [Komagataeibacter oboediens]|uniref:hypothetical protein n=1 Tax=Komagataeibacter oboediens TaxID=65958 RepID=UPI0023DBACFA|nr:hypothetical protein [Komagataeibacter oboediens]WEQ51190.1 hypothetical protein LV478_11680 [Komagataeibacter oboediens]
MSKKSPILFNADMIRAILDGRKTQTRRIMKAQPSDEISNLLVGSYHPTVVRNNGEEEPGPETFGAFSECGDFGCKAPYAPDNLLWVRETWRGIVKINAPWEAHREGVARYIPDRRLCLGVEYKASHMDNNEPWRPSIHMPRWASRLTLRVTNVRAQPLLDISEEDAKSEGFIDGELNDGFGPRDIGGGWTIESMGGWASAAGMFQIYWQKLHPDWDGFSSPWVWVYDFEVIRKNVDEVDA